MFTLLAQAQNVTGANCQNCMDWGWRGTKMMNSGWVGGSGSAVLMVILGILWFLMMVALIAVLVSLARWLWRKGDEESGKSKKS